MLMLSIDYADSATENPPAQKMQMYPRGSRRSSDWRRTVSIHNPDSSSALLALPTSPNLLLARVYLRAARCVQYHLDTRTASHSQQS